MSRLHRSVGELRASEGLARAEGKRGHHPTEFAPDSRPRYCRCEDERECWDSGEGHCVKCGKTIRRLYRASASRTR